MKLLQADLNQDTRLFTQADDVEDSPSNLSVKYAETRAANAKATVDAKVATKEELAETVFANYLILGEQVRFIHQAGRPFLPLSLIIEFGGLAFGLLIIGYILTRIAQARTLFLVKFTEDVFRQAANSPTKFDQASDMVGSATGENSVRPLKGKYA